MFGLWRKLLPGNALRRRFLCPNCLRWGGYRYACGGCWRAVRDKLVAAQGECPRCRQTLRPEAVRARCEHCEYGGDSAIYVQKPIRVVATLRATDYAAFCHATGVPPEQSPGGLGYAYDTGTRLVYVLNLEAVLAAAASFPALPVIQTIEAIWLDASGDDLEAQAFSLAEAADKFVRQQDVTEAMRRAMNIVVCRETPESIIEHVVTTRFGSVSYVKTATEFLCDGEAAKAVAVGQIGRNPTMPEEVWRLKSLDENVVRKAVEVLDKIDDKAVVPALANALKYSDKDVRRNAAKALGKVGDKSSVAALIAALNDSVWYSTWNNAWGTSLEKVMSVILLVPALVPGLMIGFSIGREFGLGLRFGLGLGLGLGIGLLLWILLWVASPPKLEEIRIRVREVRRSAGTALGQIGDKAAVSALKTADSKYHENKDCPFCQALHQLGE